MCAAGAGFCLWATCCTPCAYADVKQDFTGEGWLMACLAWTFCYPCHLCCFHPDFRKAVASQHGKDVGSLLLAKL